MGAKRGGRRLRAGGRNRYRRGTFTPTEGSMCPFKKNCGRITGKGLGAGGSTLLQPHSRLLRRKRAAVRAKTFLTKNPRCLKRRNVPSLRRRQNISNTQGGIHICQEYSKSSQRNGSFEAVGPKNRFVKPGQSCLEKTEQHCWGWEGQG